MRVVLIGTMLALAPTAAIAQDAPQPEYPPGFDCDTLPTSEEQEACLQSQLKPTMDQDDDRSLTGAGPETPGTVSPPTMPDQPDNENRGGNSGGVGN